MPQMDRETVRFILDGQVVAVKGAPATTTVLEYLRNTAGRTGTKEGCAEGDCGACTVVLGELAADGQSVGYHAVNSCIRLLPTIDGKELVTVESLQADARTLHPVQQAMVDQHGSQCGFCTPGFVMSLFALYLNQSRAQRSDVVDALAGNLCRCTGYRPIIEAGCRMADYPEPNRWSRAAAQTQARRDLLKTLDRNAATTLRMPYFKAPRSIDELAELLAAAPDSLLLAGGTDVVLQVTKQLRELPPLIYVGEVAELKVIRAEAGSLWIGAAVPLSTAWPALVHAYPALGEQARRFASPPICNSATLGGNVANGSPIGDSMPALIALQTQVELRKGKATRRLPLEQFYLGYQKKDLHPGEFLVGIRIPSANVRTYFASYKLAKRFEQDISAVCAAFAVELAGERVVAARLAFGGMAATPARACKAEAALIGRQWSLATVDAAADAIAEDFKPLTDLRASERYRLQTAGNLLRRFYLQQTSTAAITRAQALAPVGEA
jgi:xanthine dehydrogenase small subunit